MTAGVPIIRAAGEGDKRSFFPLRRHPDADAIRRPRARGAVTAVLAVAGLFIVNATAAVALPPGPPVRAASVRMSFAVTTFDGAEGENVGLVGAFHVVVQPSSAETGRVAVDWHVNVDHATGTGETTGRHYVLHGAARGTLPPGPPTRSATIEAAFSLFPPGPPVHPPSPIRFLLILSFDEGGQITHVEAHVVESSPPVID